jgi:hypothetical protein
LNKRLSIDEKSICKKYEIAGELDFYFYFCNPILGKNHENAATPNIDFVDVL